MVDLLNNTQDRISTLCNLHHVKHLYAFGSVLTPRFNDESDIDFVVEFRPIILEDYVDNYLSLKDSLEKLLGRSVDLLEEKGIQNPVLRRNIDRTKKLVYG